MTDNGDLSTIGYTTEILRWFKPKLTVVNMSSVYSCHGSYTSYLKSPHRGDHAGDTCEFHPDPGAGDEGQYHHDHHA